jgi:hypothetical protein
MAVAGANIPVLACGVVVITEVGAYCGRVVGVSVGTAVSVGEGVKVGVSEAVGLGPTVGDKVSVGTAVSVGTSVGDGKRVEVIVGSSATADKDARVGTSCAPEMKYLSQTAGNTKSPKIIRKTRPKPIDRFTFTVQIYTLRPWTVGELNDERR